MKILVLSDTHGAMRKSFEIVQKLKEDENIDLMIHLGDLVHDGREIGERFNIPSIIVRGNNDFNCKVSTLDFNGGEKFIEKEDEDAWYKVVNTDAGKILISHGHREKVDLTLNNIIYKAEEHGCIGVCFGHTHTAINENIGDMLILNPGSLSLPRDSKQGSYAILEATERGIKGKIHRVKDGDKPIGGYIRNLINYSDRF